MKKVGIAYIWRGKKEKGTDNHFYAGATHQDLDRRLTFPTQNNELFTNKEDIELIHAEVFSDKEKALQCEAAFIFFLKTLMRYHVIDCVNKNHNKYAYYLTKAWALCSLERFDEALDAIEEGMNKTLEEDGCVPCFTNNCWRVEHLELLRNPPYRKRLEAIIGPKPKLARKTQDR